LRQFIKQLTPPLLLDVVKRVIGRPEPEPQLFSSWEAACDAAEGSYSSQLVNEFRVDRWRYNREQERSPVRYDLGSFILVAALCGPNTRVTDFGGATGHSGEALLALVPTVNYTVVENETLVSLMGQTPSLIRFVTRIPDQCDIFFTSGTLQSISDPYAMLDRGFASARRAVIITRTRFCDEEMFQVQESWLFHNATGLVPPGYENVKIQYPKRTISESSVQEIAARNGFRLMARFDDEHERVFLRSGT
jgi:putative methyltransferase (TIGR04325 family)